MSKFERVAVIYDPEEALVALGFLQANGLDAVLGDPHAYATMPLYRIAFGGHRLLVPTDQANEARQLLNSVEKEHPGKGFQYDGVACANCGGKNFTRVKPWLLPLALMSFFGMPLWWNSDRLRCTQCKTVTKIKEDVESR